MTNYINLFYYSFMTRNNDISPTLLEINHTKMQTWKYRNILFYTQITLMGGFVLSL